MKKFLLFVLLLIPTVVYCSGNAWLGPDRSKWPDTEFRKVKNDFAGLLLVTSDTDWQTKWDTPPDTVPYFSEAKTVKVGQEVVVLTFFANPKVDQKGNANVTCSIRATRPNGTISLERQGIECMKGKLEGAADNMRLSPAIIKFVGEKSDPLGTWLVEVEIEDLNRSTKLQLKTRFELVP